MEFYDQFYMQAKVNHNHNSPNKFTLTTYGPGRHVHNLFPIDDHEHISNSTVVLFMLWYPKSKVAVIAYVQSSMLLPLY